MEDKENLLKLPSSWICSKLEDIAEIIMGQSPPGDSYNVDGVGIPLINGPVEFGSSPFSKTIKSKFTTLPTKMCKEGDLILCVRGSTTGRMNIAGFDACIGRGVAAIRSHLYQQYLNAFIHFNQYQIHRLGTGSTFPNVSADILNKIVIPLPPLNEQRRIVAKIEALSARSQRVKEALLDIPQLLDQFRQSVLAAAFRGDITADWRSQNPDVAEWEKTTLQEVIKSKPRNGYSPKPVDYPTKVKSITLSATTSGIFKPEYIKYINEDIPIDSYLWLNPGDILIQRSNTLEYVGTCAIYTGSFGEFIYPDLIMKIQVIQEKATPEFIYYALSNKASRLYFRINATGTAGNMPKINQQVVMNTPISLPCIEEQKEIVHQIKSLYEAVDIIKQQYQETKAHLDQLDQSILAKAFRGELVPQDPNDEPASILLERIREERAKLQTKTAKKSTAATSARRTKKIQPQEESVQLELGLE